MIEAMVPGFSFDVFPPMVRQSLELNLLFLDPPDHTKIRRLLGTALNAELRSLRPWLERTVQEQVESLLRRPSVDLQTEFADRIPAFVMGKLYGLEADERDHCQQMTYRSGPLFGASPSLSDEGCRNEILDCIRQLSESIANLLFMSKTSTPLLDSIRAGIHSGEWSQDEALGAAVQLFAAGVLTTGDVMGLGVLELLRDPTRATSVMKDGRLPALAVDEVIRFTSPAQVMHRVVRHDLELGGEQLKAGQLVYVVIAAANRDPEHFEQPNELRLARANAAEHIGYGAGVHHCVGAALARLELRVSMSALAPHLSKWSVNSDPEFREITLAFRGLTGLPVSTDGGTVESAEAS